MKPIYNFLNESLKTNFKVGDIVQDSSGYHRLLILEIDKEHNCYKCADTLLGRDWDIKIIDKNIPGYLYDKDFEIFKYNGKWDPIVADEIVDKYKLPNNWRLSEWKKRNH